MKHSLNYLVILLILVLSVLYSCSDDAPKVDEILLTLSKDVALSMGDSVLIMTEVHSEIDERLQNIPLQYFVDNKELSGPVFYPDQVGTFRISARYEDVISEMRDVKVISLEQSITSLRLDYIGNTYLTTEEWSVSGDFLFEVRFDYIGFQVETNEIDLLINGIPTEERTGIHFDQPGEYEFKASFGSLSSDPVVIEVREKLSLNEVVIPVVFHDYGLGYSISEVNRLLDTLNGAFNIGRFSKEDVLEGIVNPNAVNMKMRFVPASEPPEGEVLFGPGLHRIDTPEGIPSFHALVSEHTWDPERYVNIWIYDEFLDFDAEENGQYVFYGRGTASRPGLLNYSLDGLENFEAESPDPTAGIGVFSLSVFGEHPDYIVSMMAIYYGLFETFELECRDSGDYINDTPTIDFSSIEGTGNFLYNCEEQLFRPSNFLSIKRNYRDFTYDQAIRIRTVMKHGLSRVN